MESDRRSSNVPRLQVEAIDEADGTSDKGRSPVLNNQEVKLKPLTEDELQEYR